MTNWGKGTKPKTCPIHIPEDLHRAFKAVCARRGLGVGKVAAEIIAAWIAAQEQKERSDDRE